MIIDTHTHVWSDDYERYPTPNGRKHSMPGSTEFLLETMAKHNVDHAVLVQFIAYWYDNSYIIDTMKQYPGKFAAIGLINWFEPGAPDRLEKLVKEHGFAGLRFHTYRAPNGPANWLGPQQRNVWKKAQELGSSFIIHAKPEHLPIVEPVIAAFPGVSVTLDHQGGIPRVEDPPHPMLQNLLAYAKYPNVVVKYSVAREKGREDYPYRDTFPMFRRIYDAFGPQRIMWGSNFPEVFDQTKGYEEVLDIFRKHLDFLSKNDLE
ncbi:MAG: amidohydrolase [SAR202 cluster bacterium]|nr:amidohydrolase [SAR202 cluster bacterium]